LSSAILLLILNILFLSQSENQIQQEIRLAVGQEKNLRLFRNETGSLPNPRTGKWVDFGLAKGSSDLIGFKTIEVTPDMVGEKLAVFTSIEVKNKRGKVSELQHNWLQVVKKAGGITGVARSIQDALNILKIN
tara:strand:- start:420 stop:818 length:399 start_codon:yes stop_codon:yes gene_type:complete